MLDSEVEDVDNGTITRDVDMSFAPAFDINGLVSYSWPVWNGELEVQGNFNYIDNRFNNNFNDPASDLEESFVANARLAYITANKDWEVSFFVKNLTDEANLIKIFVFRLATDRPCMIHHAGLAVRFARTGIKFH